MGESLLIRLGDLNRPPKIRVATYAERNKKMEIVTRIHMLGGYYSRWEHKDRLGFAMSHKSPEQSEKNAIAQARRIFGKEEFLDYDGNPQSIVKERRLNERGIR